MTVPAGSYPIGPANGRLLLRTYRTGLAARVGHDLVIEAAAWRGSVTVPETGPGQAEVRVVVDMAALRVRDGTGGVVALAERDIREIESNLRKVLRVDTCPAATFVSTQVRSAQLAGGVVQGVVQGLLTLAGASAPLELAVTLTGDATARATGSVVQTRWGIKPYTAMLGALKLRDAVDVEAEVRIGS